MWKIWCDGIQRRYLTSGRKIVLIALNCIILATLLESPAEGHVSQLGPVKAKFNLKPFLSNRIYLLIGIRLWHFMVGFFRQEPWCRKEKLENVDNGRAEHYFELLSSRPFNQLPVLFLRSCEVCTTPLLKPHWLPLFFYRITAQRYFVF